ncbi:MAG: MbnP family protein [Bacteroidota bacterium]
MKKLSFILALSILFIASSCDNDDPILSEVTSVDLNFKANFNGERLLMGKTYDYNGRSVRFSLFDFYLSDVAMVQNNGSSIEESELIEIDLVDLSFQQTEPDVAESGRTISINNVEVGDYAGIKLGIGVTADLNRTSFVDYPSSHPLNSAAHYWSGWNSFIFARVEGRFDADGDGSFEKGFVFHTGTDDTYTFKDISQSLTLEKENTSTLVFDLDIKELFKITDPICDEDGDGYIDLHLGNCDGTHTDGELELAKAIMGNFRTAIQMIE